MFDFRINLAKQKTFKANVKRQKTKFGSFSDDGSGGRIEITPLKIVISMFEMVISPLKIAASHFKHGYNPL